MSVVTAAESTRRQDPTRSDRWTDALLTVGQFLLIAVLLFVYLRGWDRDFRVPLRFSRDSLSAGMQSKSTVDNGWWWYNPRVGAPFGLDELQYPAASNVDQGVVWMVSRVVRDWPTAGNLAWLLMVILSGLSATWGMRQLGASRPSGLVAGTLFALTPYALYRSTGHFWLVIYLVPFVGTAALFLASGRPARWYWGKPFLGLIAGCGLIAFNYVYYAFFGCFILIVASVTGFLQYRAWRVLGAGALCVMLIGGCTYINLAPSLHSWAVRGQPLAVPAKTPAESELYGLKIRQLVSPGLWHRFPPFRAWLTREEAAAFPLETENGSSRLGLVATGGFLALLGFLFVPRLSQTLGHRDTLLAASRLTLASVLLATVGGFGSLVNLLVTPEIRAYNRISPFITFFSLTAVALAIDSLFTSQRRRVAAALTIGVIGLADQRAATVYLNGVHKDIAAEFASLTGLVRQLENQLPAAAMIFELPFRMYPNDDGGPRGQPYENLKPYLASRTLRWSYPALSNQQWRWQQAAALLTPPRLVRELASGGFAAILVDREGYADSGAAIVGALRDATGQGAVIGETSRYIVLDIRRLASAASASSFLANAGGAAPMTMGLVACAGQTLTGLNQLGPATAPFGASPVHVARSRAFKVSGWAVDQAAESSGAGVDVLMDQTLFQTIYGLDRGDVAIALKGPGYQQSGFIAEVPASRFAPGPHTLALRVARADGQCYYQTPPSAVVID